jgi:hypothetical protein
VAGKPAGLLQGSGKTVCGEQVVLLPINDESRDRLFFEGVSEDPGTT